MTTDTHMVPEVITALEAAELIGISPNTAYRWCKSGTMPGLLPRIGKAHRVNRAHLIAYLAGEVA